MNNGGNNDGESILTFNDIQAAVRKYQNSTNDPLGQFPDLQQLAIASCGAIAQLLIYNEASQTLAETAAQTAYKLAIVASLSMHHAVWRAVLPEDGPMNA